MEFRLNIEVYLMGFRARISGDSPPGVSESGRNSVIVPLLIHIL